MRARGDSATEILTAESMADKFGVQHGSYESVALPGNANVQQVYVRLYLYREKRVQCSLTGVARTAPLGHAPENARASEHAVPRVFGKHAGVVHEISCKDRPEISNVRFRQLTAIRLMSQVMCEAGGQPADVLKLAPGRLPQALEWGEVLINIRFAAINPADVRVLLRFELMA